jgi:hypothetical protein
MTPGNGSGFDRSASLRYAAEVLDLAPDVSAELARTAFLDHLSEENFLPTPIEREAFEVLIGRKSLDLCPLLAESMRRSKQEQLQPKVEQFAAAFFSLPVAERRQRWQELRADCGDGGPLGAQLERLQRGLSIDPAALRVRSSDVERLVKHILELFVLHPRLEPIRREALVANLRGASKKGLGQWPEAVRQLKRRYPEVAALAPVLLAQLAPPRERTTPKRQSAPVAPVSKKTAGNPRQTWFPLIFVVAVVGGVIRMMNQAPSERPEPSITTPPFPTIPSPPPLFPPTSLNLSATPYLSWLNAPARERFKKTLKDGLAKLGHKLSDAQLETLLDRSLDVNSMIILTGTRVDVTNAEKSWKAELSAGLRDAGVSIEDPELDLLFLEVFPELVGRIALTPGAPTNGGAAPPVLAPPTGSRPPEVPAP